MGSAGFGLEMAVSHTFGFASSSMSTDPIPSRTRFVALVVGFWQELLMVVPNALGMGSRSEEGSQEARLAPDQTDLARRIIHVDMDAFYASVEQRDHPELLHRPVLVGGDHKRGVVCAASYEARKFGCRSAMPTAKALQLCPHAVLVPPRFAAYQAASSQIHAIFREATSQIEPIALDESFLDVTQRCAESGEKAGSIAWAIKEKISAQLHLSASAGVGCNKLVAKIASGFRKPNGLTVVAPDQTLPFLWPLEVGELWGVGPVAQSKLLKLGVKTVQDLHAIDQAQLISHFGKFGLTLWEMARGIDHRAVEAHRETKSISAEHTFESDIVGPEALALMSSLLSHQVDEVTHRLKSEGLEAHTVTVKFKFSDFSNRTRSQKLGGPCQDSSIFDQCAQTLLASQMPLPPVRLIGVGLSQLCPVERTRQLELDLF